VPPPATTTDARFFLLSTLQFDVGTPVRLYGGIEVSTTSGLTFVLGRKMPWDPQLLPPGQATTSISEPFGMTGVRLDELDVNAHLYKDPNTGSAAVDLTVVAVATFPNLSGFRLEGALVLQQSQPRLALVRLSTTTPLTLRDFVTAVVGSGWDWGATDQLAFISGDLYYLKPPPNQPSFTFPYPASDGTTLTCTPGYHADAKLQLFGKYTFSISLAVVPLTAGGNAVTLSTTLLTPIVFDFITFKNPSLELSTNPTTGKYLRISTDILLFGTTFTVAAAYQQGAFIGSVTADLGQLSLPVVGGSTGADVTLRVEFAWQQGSFSITRIDGLPSLDNNLAQEFSKYVNGMSGGCAQIVSRCFDDLSQTTLSPALDGSPTKSGGQMQVNLNVTYNMKVAGQSVATAVIPVPLTFDIPTSLSDLPRALCMSLVDSAASIVAAMLGNEDTYKAMALEVGRRAGAQVMARLICRAVEKGLQAAAEALARAAAGMAAETLAAAAELAAALASVALMGFSATLSGFMELLDKLVGWITGKDKEKKEQAEDQIRAQGARIQQALSGVFAAIDTARGRLALKALDVNVDAAGNFVAAWSMANFDPSELGDGPTVTYTLTLLQDAPGTRGAAPWSSRLAPVTGMPVDTASRSISLASIPDAAGFGMNASIVAIATGVTILKPQTQGDLQNAIDQLNGTGNGVAQDVAAGLQTQLNQLIQYNDAGITSDTMYATLQAPATVVVGQSQVGVTTRLGTPPA
jgi:hypothetical protein